MRIYPKILVYGEPGVGKTRLLATAPRPAVIETDPEGELSLRGTGVPFIKAATLSDFRQAWSIVSRKLAEFDTIAIDSLTNLQRIGLDEIISAEELLVAQQDWGMSFRQIRHMVMILNKLQKIVIYICGERTRELGVPAVKQSVPNLTPSVAALLNDHCRVIGRMVKKAVLKDDGRKVLQTELHVYHGGRFWGKDTSGRLPSILRGPQVNVTWIFNRINQITE